MKSCPKLWLANALAGRVEIGVLSHGTLRLFTLLLKEHHRLSAAELTLFDLLLRSAEETLQVIECLFVFRILAERDDLLLLLRAKARLDQVVVQG